MERQGAAAGTESGVASHRIADHLRRMILDDELLPGERIRQESIAEEFGVSRLPVREALRILESEGLTVLKANSGARVSFMDMEEYQAVYRLRERLEPLVLAESIPNLTDDVIARLEQIHEEICALEGDLARFLNLDRELHLLTYSGCRISMHSTMVHRFWNTTQHYRRAFVRLAGQRHSWVIDAEHGLLIEAIKTRDTVGAESILEGHIRRTRVQLAQHPEVFESVSQRGKGRNR